MLWTEKADCFSTYFNTYSIIIPAIVMFQDELSKLIPNGIFRHVRPANRFQRELMLLSP